MRDLPIYKGADVVGIEGRVIDLVEDQDHRLAQLIAQAADDLHHVGGMVDVQVVGGLIQQDIFRVLGDDHGDHGPLALAAGELVQEAVLKVLQFHVGDGLVDDGLVLLGDPAAGVREAAEGHQLPDGELHLDVVALGEDGQALGQLLALPLGNVPPGKVHQAAVPGDEPGQHPHHRGLPRPVGADEGEDLPLGDGKGHPVHHPFAVVLLGEV